MAENQKKAKKSSSSSTQQYRIFRVEVDQKTKKEKQITMKRFSAKSDADAYDVLKKYRSIANKEYTYYYGHANSYQTIGKDKKIRKFDTSEELHEFTMKEHFSSFQNTFKTPFIKLADVCSDIKYWFKDLFYWLKTKHNRNESWSLDSHILDDLRHNLQLIIDDVEKGPAGIPNDMCIKALKEKHKNDPNFDIEKAYNANPNIIWDEEGVMDLATNMWISTLKTGLLNVKLYCYYADYGIIDEKNDKDMIEIHEKYASTIPYVPGTYKEIDYQKLAKMTEKCWNSIWNWIKEHGQSLWT